MNFSVFTIPPFDKQLKKLVKKYPSLVNEFAELIKNLETLPEQGTALRQNCYKIRFAIKSKGKGKRGGARFITNIMVSDSIVYLKVIRYWRPTNAKPFPNSSRKLCKSSINFVSNSFSEYKFPSGIPKNSKIYGCFIISFSVVGL